MHATGFIKNNTTKKGHTQKFKSNLLPLALFHILKWTAHEPTSMSLTDQFQSNLNNGVQLYSPRHEE